MHNAKMFSSGYLQVLRFTIHSFLQRVFIEHFVYVVVMINSGTMVENTAGKTLPYGAYFQWERQKRNKRTNTKRALNCY